MWLGFAMNKDFVQLPHTADIKIRVFGATKEELFCNALIGMFQVVKPMSPGCHTQGDRVVCKELPQHREIVATSIDISALLIDFLSEALYLSDSFNEAYLDATIHELTDTSVKATVDGVKVTGFEVVELKAVTHHGCEIKQVDGMWQTDIVFDI